MQPTREQLLLAATQSVQRRGLSLTQDGWQAISKLIDEGVRRLESDGVSSDAQVILTAIERVVAESAAVHRSRRAIDAKRGIGELEITAALRSLCPLYPFC